MIYNISDNNILTISIEGRLDASSAPEMQDEIMSIIEDSKPSSILFDLYGLEYISSMGLRVIMKASKEVSDVKIINVSQEVYDIFATTGFSNIFSISKALRTISLDCCEMIGYGSNVAVYRISDDDVVKVYDEGVSLTEIEKERESAKEAFVLGLPTSISYETVIIDDGRYGTVFELIDARSMWSIINEDPNMIDTMAYIAAELINKFNSAVSGNLPSIKENILSAIEEIKSKISERQYDIAKSMLLSIPESNHVIHGDMQAKNIMLQNGEPVFIDMGTLSTGNVVFELAGIYGLCESNITEREKMIAEDLWNKTIQAYLSASSYEEIYTAKMKAKTVYYICSMCKAGKDNDDALYEYAERLEACANDSSITSTGLAI